ncbi:unnamed protein product [Pseudo-nitzschia multistriata]|uniref:Uncharacterized protein n=1 Tax=Pseudo-nitzschia multistriata TaxID=183589 RepID=A0A448YWI4_9STRA|nr:unnamed protein product [Pseudo-nitzschia multistriata]
MDAKGPVVLIGWRDLLRNKKAQPKSETAFAAHNPGLHVHRHLALLPVGSLPKGRPPKALLLVPPLRPLFSLPGHLPRGYAAPERADEHPDRPQGHPADDHAPDRSGRGLGLALLLHPALAGVHVVVVVRPTRVGKVLRGRDLQVKAGPVRPRDRVGPGVRAAFAAVSDRVAIDDECDDNEVEQQDDGVGETDPNRCSFVLVAVAVAGMRDEEGSRSRSEVAVRKLVVSVEVGDTNEERRSIECGYQSEGFRPSLLSHWS